MTLNPVLFLFKIGGRNYPKNRQKWAFFDCLRIFVARNFWALKPKLWKHIIQPKIFVEKNSQLQTFVSVAVGPL